MTGFPRERASGPATAVPSRGRRLRRRPPSPSKARVGTERSPPLPRPGAHPPATSRTPTGRSPPTPTGARSPKRCGLAAYWHRHGGPDTGRPHPEAAPDPASPPPRPAPADGDPSTTGTATCARRTRPRPRRRGGRPAPTAGRPSPAPTTRPSRRRGAHRAGTAPDPADRPRPPARRTAGHRTRHPRRCYPTRRAHFTLHLGRPLLPSEERPQPAPGRATGAARPRPEPAGPAHPLPPHPGARRGGHRRAGRLRRPLAALPAPGAGHRLRPRPARRRRPDHADLAGDLRPPRRGRRTLRRLPRCPRRPRARAAHRYRHPAPPRRPCPRRPLRTPRRRGRPGLPGRHRRTRPRLGRPAADDLLGRLGHAGPTALVHLLPPHLRHRTSLYPYQAVLEAGGFGAANDGLGHWAPPGAPTRCARCPRRTTVPCRCRPLPQGRLARHLGRPRHRRAGRTPLPARGGRRHPRQGAPAPGCAPPGCRAPPAPPYAASSPSPRPPHAGSPPNSPPSRSTSTWWNSCGAAPCRRPARTTSPRSSWAV